MSPKRLGIAVFDVTEPSSLRACLDALVRGPLRPARLAVVAVESKKHWIEPVVAAWPHDDIPLDLVRPAARSDEVATALWRSSFGCDAGLTWPGSLVLADGGLAAVAGPFLDGPLQAELITFPDVRCPASEGAADLVRLWATAPFIDVPHALASVAFLHRGDTLLPTVLAGTPDALPPWFRMNEVLASLVPDGPVGQRTVTGVAIVPNGRERRSALQEARRIALALRNYEWFQSTDRDIARSELRRLRRFMRFQLLANPGRRRYAATFLQGLRSADATFDGLRRAIHRDLEDLC